jgi:hypothetical protein
MEHWTGYRDLNLNGFGSQHSFHRAQTPTGRGGHRVQRDMPTREAIFEPNKQKYKRSMTVPVETAFAPFLPLRSF